MRKPVTIEEYRLWANRKGVWFTTDYSDGTSRDERLGAISASDACRIVARWLGVDLEDLVDGAEINGVIYRELLDKDDEDDEE